MDESDIHLQILHICPRLLWRSLTSAIVNLSVKMPDFKDTHLCLQVKNLSHSKLIANLELVNM